MKQNKIGTIMGLGSVLMIVGISSFSNHDSLGDTMKIIGGALMVYAAILRMIDKNKTSRC